MKNKIVKHKNKSPIKGNFSIKEAEEFLKSTKNKNEIDLHGKRLVGSMYIVHNKIISLKQKKKRRFLKGNNFDNHNRSWVSFSWG